MEPSVSLRYGVRLDPDGWELPEGPVPESAPHDDLCDRWKHVLQGWVSRTGRDAEVYRNLAVRFDPQRPRVGIDPDVCVVEPAPEERRALTSLQTYVHGSPLLSIEIVSTTHPSKDYVEAPARHAASGVKELWVLDPLLAGPRLHGGPFVVQVWQRDDAGAFTRVHASNEPFHSTLLDAWIVPGRGMVQLCEDRGGARPWRTLEEATADDAVTAMEAAVAAKDAALRELAELRARVGTG
ncbi:MAG: Uma2 family endonuclease [Myxococcales bacterium]|nr:Uma2 family endonuclease [Myxococcales bacterium]